MSYGHSYNSPPTTLLKQNVPCQRFLWGEEARGWVMRSVMMFAKFKTVAALVLFSMLVSVPVRAQVSGATLSGTVTDVAGSAVPSAIVSIKNTATGITREVSTDSAGFYSAPNLPPAVYEVTASAPGF